MRLGAALPVRSLAGGPLESGTLAEGAALLESLGYSSLWVFDSVGRGFMLPDPVTALAVAATATSDVELGTGVVQLPLRNTAELAWRALTLHLVSGGRLLFGVGTGSTRADFETLDADYEGRFQHFADEFPRLAELLRTGQHGDTALHPWPAARGGPRLLVGAWRGGWVERAATEADGWIASARHNDEPTLREAVARYKAADGRRAVVTNVQVDDDLAVTVERLRRLDSFGFDDAVTIDLRPSPARYAELRERLT
jgi:alkanesulfonate monooxygenase SsuD/methylene tetrahydromethanopterin reductase-like flavin-dependent oxidoreductase (luciferase family)